MLHEVGISLYFMMKKHGLTNLKIPGFILIFILKKTKICNPLRIYYLETSLRLEYDNLLPVTDTDLQEHVILQIRCIK